MSDLTVKFCEIDMEQLKKSLNRLKFADRVQMIHKLVKLIVETLDGMEAEVKRECP